MRGTQNILVSVYHPDSTGGKAADNVRAAIWRAENQYPEIYAALRYNISKMEMALRGNRKKAFEAGMNAHIAKPFSMMPCWQGWIKH